MSKIALPKLILGVSGIQNLSFDLADNVMARWDSALQAKDEGDNAISIYDPIGQGFFGDGVTAKRVAAALRSIGDRDVIVNLNSPGGDFFEGIAIYNLLRDHPHQVTVRVLGSAFSAASIIAMAGDTIQIARAGFMMIHNVWMFAMGNRNDLRELADKIEPFDRAMADLYAARTGADSKAVAKLMDKETWFGGEEAIEEGFADELLPADQVEEKKDGAKPAAAAMRRVDSALQKQGMPRSERRLLLRQLAGMPGAASDAKPSAGEQPGYEFLQIVADLTARTNLKTP